VPSVPISPKAPINFKIAGINRLIGILRGKGCGGGSRDRYQGKTKSAGLRVFLQGLGHILGIAKEAQGALGFKGGVFANLAFDGAGGGFIGWLRLGIHRDIRTGTAQHHGLAIQIISDELLNLGRVLNFLVQAEILLYVNSIPRYRAISIPRFVSVNYYEIIKLFLRIRRDP
jgi:hypothetical protein